MNVACGKKNRFGKRWRSVYITLLLSYLAIFLLPVAIGSILYKKTEAIMVDQANRTNLVMLEQLRQVVDGQLKDVEQISTQIAFHPRLQWLLSNAQSMEMADSYRFIEFMRDQMQQHQNTSDIVFDYYVYFRNTDTVITPSAKTGSRMLYDGLYTIPGVPYEEWRGRMLHTVHYRGYMPVAYQTPSGKLDTVTYVQTLPVGELTDVRGALVVLLDLKHIRRMLQSIEGASQSSIYILNREHQLMTSNPQAAPWESVRHVQRQEGEPYEFVSNGTTMVYMHTASEQNGWKYVLMMPKEVYMERVNAVTHWAVTLLLICLVGGAAAIFYLLRRNYAPLREVVRVLKTKNPVGDEELANEYDFIRETVRMTIDEEQQLRSILSRQTPVIQANFLSRLIRGQVDSSMMTSDSLQFMDIRFVSDDFTVVIIEIADFSRFSQDQSERQWALIRFIIANISGDLVRERTWGYAVELDRHRLALMVNYYEERLDRAEEDLAAIIRRLKQMMEERYKTHMTIAVGSLHRGLGQIGESYLEALSALEYKLFRGRSVVIHYREIADVEGRYYYPIETDIQLINLTKSGDVDSVKTLLHSIFDRHFSAERMTPELGRSLFTNLVNTLWKVMNPMDDRYAEVFGADFYPFKQLDACGTVEEMKGHIEAWFIRLCLYMQENRSHPSRQLIEAIEQYIAERYGDSMLSLTAIAEQFGLTPQYLSAFFKKQTGMNLTDYISRLRIEQAKRLMRDKSMTFSQIARQIGYASDIGFIRVFKKNEGMTPGKYRETLE